MIRSAAARDVSLCGQERGGAAPPRVAGSVQRSYVRAATRGGDIVLAGVPLVADHAGALYWPAEGVLAVADLHLEKGSSFARRGVMLPPYDSAATLANLTAVIARYDPRAVVALGDSFHDREGSTRLADADRDTLAMLQRGRDWIWIAGNHDPDPCAGIGGQFAGMLAIGALTFSHVPSREAVSGEVAGHLHPAATLLKRGRGVSRRCFATDGRRMVVPAFGAYAGGLNVRHSAIAGLFEGLSFEVHMLGRERVYAIPARRCSPG